MRLLSSTHVPSHCCTVSSRIGYYLPDSPGRHFTQWGLCYFIPGQQTPGQCRDNGIDINVKTLSVTVLTPKLPWTLTKHQWNEIIYCWFTRWVIKTQKWTGQSASQRCTQSCWSARVRDMCCTAVPASITGMSISCVHVSAVPACFS